LLQLPLRTKFRRLSCNICLNSPQPIRARRPSADHRELAPINSFRQHAALPYTIRFENPSDATTHVAEIRVVTTLDDSLSVRSFRLGDIKIGDISIHVPDGRASFQGDFDFNAVEGICSSRQRRHRPNSRIATWIIQAIDPETGEVLQDATRGLLSPNDAQGHGAGYVHITCSLHLKRRAAILSRRQRV